MVLGDRNCELTYILRTCDTGFEARDAAEETEK